MDQNNLNQIFQHYIEKFDYINNTEHIEYYKWQICEEFPVRMKAALSADTKDFSKALYEAKKCTYNIIDSYTQPFSGLVDFAKPENNPEAVRKMFMDLYADDGGDLKVQMEKIADFFNRSNDLLDKYATGSFLYKQNSHSVSAYLFLNDPDHHHMFKATHCRRFADCVEFYDDWGGGDNIKLDVYYRMCEELVEHIKECPELLSTDNSRFDGRLKLSGGPLHPDKEKHILAFDLIYCCSTYDLFDGISYTKRNMKEKQLYLANKKKAQELKEALDKAKADYDLLDEALGYFLGRMSKGATIVHKKHGTGIIESADTRNITASFNGNTVQFGLPVCIANDIISLDFPEFAEMADKYKPVLKRYNNIPMTLDRAAKDFEEYEEYLD